MPGMLGGKTALITGAGGGIGRAAALMFAREGARVAVTDISEKEIKLTVKMVQEKGGEAIAVVADITREADVAKMVAATVDAFGTLDCAFNNAGVSGGQLGAGGLKLADWTDAAFTKIIEINLKGTWLCLKHEIAQMKKQKHGGSIVNTGSIAGLVGRPGSSGYVASKHGIIGLTKTAALEYADVGIRVNSVCPGFVETSMSTLKDKGPEIYEKAISTIPLRRISSPEEVVNLVVWCCSEQGSYVTGAIYNVDGGYLAF